MRVRIVFEKTQAMRYTSHLDLQRAWERTIRRAQLSLVYSQGFNPRPKINLAAALPLGFTSECEIIEFWLKEEVALTQIQKNLQTALPPGIQIVTVESIKSANPKLPNLVEKTIYEVILLEPTPNLGERISEILDEDKIIRERRGKKYDLRPLIISIEMIEASDSGKQRMKLVLLAKPSKTGRPDEVLAALEIPNHLARIHRKEIILTSLNNIRSE